MKFFITHHAGERYIERIRGGINPTTTNLFTDMLKELSTGKDITNKIYDEVPRYILYLYEKYKQLGLTIIHSNQTLYICRKRPGTQNLFDVITCYNDHRHLEQFKNTAMSREEVFLKIKMIKKQLKS